MTEGVLDRLAGEREHLRAHDHPVESVQENVIVMTTDPESQEAEEGEGPVQVEHRLDEEPIRGTEGVIVLRLPSVGAELPDRPPADHLDRDHHHRRGKHAQMSSSKNLDARLGRRKRNSSRLSPRE